MQFQEREAPVKPVPVQEDFYLLDVIGGGSQTALHPTRPIVAYTSGCMIIVYDLMTDNKINLVHHQHEVFALAFSPAGAGQSQTGGDFLISIDFDRNDATDSYTASSSKMCLWNWQKGQCLQEALIPKSQNNNGYISQSSLARSLNERHIQIAFEKVGGFFFVLESGMQNDSGSGYRVTAWNLNRQQRLELQGQMELELQNGCLGIQILSKNPITTLQSVASGSAMSRYSSQQQFYASQKLRFITLERQTIKIWEYDSGNADLLKRIQIKQPLKECLVADLTDHLVILGDNGKVLILDQEGEFVSTIKKDLVFFATITTAHDKLLLGTDRGTICVYHLASLQFISEVPYQLGLVQSFQLNQQSLNERNEGEFNLFSLGPPVQQISTTSNMRFLFIKYLDQSFVVVDRTAQNPQQGIMGYQYGHFQNVSQIQWMTAASTKKQIAFNDSSSKAWNQSTFITCSSDMSIFVWRHFGDRWAFSYIDVVKSCFDSSLTFQRKLNERSTQSLELTALRVYPKSQMIVVGDNKGTVRVFQVGQDRAVFLSAYQLIKEYDHINQSEDQIKDIHITCDEQYAIIAFSSGLICCYDVKNSYNLVGLVEKDAQRFCYANQLELRMRILENEAPALRIQDEHPLFMNTSSFDNDLSGLSSGSYQTSFRILSTVTPNSISLQLVQIRGQRVVKTPIQQFTIDEGKIVGFEIHPSHDYLLVTSNQGRIYLYRIDTGELRGTIRIPLHAQETLVDPSGLYVMIKVPPFSSKFTQNLQSEHIPDALGQIQSHERDLERTTLLMFEIGTGRACAELKSVFEVSTFAFSSDGKYLSMGSKTGSVCIWALGDHLYQNIKQVLDSIKIQPNFWTNFPIFLEDYGKYGLIESPMATMPVEEQLKDNLIPRYNMEPEFSSERDFTSERKIIDTEKRNHVFVPAYIKYGNNSPHPKGLSAQKVQQVFSPNDIFKHEQQQLFARKQPPKEHIDRSIQNYIPSQRMNDHQKISQVKQSQDHIKNHFYRKTFVEDQQTQITPHVSSYINQRSQQEAFQPQKSAMIQTSQQQYKDVHAQNLNKHTIGRKNFESQSSLISSPNRAELLYQEAPIHYVEKGSQQLSFDPNQILPSQYLDMNVHKKEYPQQQQIYTGTQRNSSQKRQPEYIDKVIQNNEVHQQTRKLPSPQKNVFLSDEPLIQDQQIYGERYTDMDQIYNPFNQSVKANQYGTLPMSSIRPSPDRQDFMSYGPAPNIGGRIQPVDKRQVVSDPIDIDDDVSDHGPDSLEHQLQELDGMNKYLNGIKIPTRFVHDDFIHQHGRDGEKAYTLGRLREEERLISMGEPTPDMLGEATSNTGSNYDLVEEVYENMNSFDKKMKLQKMMQNNNNHYHKENLYF